MKIFAIFAYFTYIGNITKKICRYCAVSKLIKTRIFVIINLCTGKYCYFSTNWSTVYAYMWSNANPKMMTWPGVQMTKVNGNVYSAEIPDGATSIIFSNNGNNQTADLTINAGKLYENGSWSDYNA